MAVLPQAFVAAALPENKSDFAPLPAGWYESNIDRAEIRKTKSGTGTMIAIAYRISGPTHNNRIIFSNINIANPNTTAQEIGLSQLRSVMIIGGLDTLSETDELIGIAIRIKLKLTKSEQYGDGNDVSAFEPPTDNVGFIPSSQPPQAQPMPQPMPTQSMQQPQSVVNNTPQQPQQPQQPQPTQQQPPQPQQNFDSDVPF